MKMTNNDYLTLIDVCLDESGMTLIQLAAAIESYCEERLSMDVEDGVDEDVQVPGYIVFADLARAVKYAVTTERTVRMAHPDSKRAARYYPVR